MDESSSKKAMKDTGVFQIDLLRWLFAMTDNEDAVKRAHEKILALVSRTPVNPRYPTQLQVEIKQKIKTRIAFNVGLEEKMREPFDDYMKGLLGDYGEKW